MRLGERVAVYGGLAVAVVAAVGANVPAIGNAAERGWAGASEPVRIATCDVYEVADKLMSSERFAPAVQEEQSRLMAALEPLRREVEELQGRLQGASPQDADAQRLFAEFQQKQQNLVRRSQEADAAFQKFVAERYVEAYEEVRASVDGVATALGYTHVIAARTSEEKITALNGLQLTQSLLARPVLKAPAGTDITDDVFTDLKLR